jgi:hypothetical protein
MPPKRRLTPNKDAITTKADTDGKCLMCVCMWWRWGVFVSVWVWLCVLSCPCVRLVSLLHDLCSGTCLTCKEKQTEQCHRHESRNGWYECVFLVAMRRVCVCVCLTMYYVGESVSCSSSSASSSSSSKPSTTTVYGSHTQKHTVTSRPTNTNTNTLFICSESNDQRGNRSCSTCYSNRTSCAEW